MPSRRHSASRRAGCEDRRHHLPKTWHWWATRALAVAAPMPEETPVTTTTLSILTMTPRLSPGTSLYLLRSQPDSSQSSCCLAVAMYAHHVVGIRCSKSILQWPV